MRKNSLEITATRVCVMVTDFDIMRTTPSLFHAAVQISEIVLDRDDEILHLVFFAMCSSAHVQLNASIFWFAL